MKTLKVSSSLMSRVFFSGKRKFDVPFGCVPRSVAASISTGKAPKNFLATNSQRLSPWCLKVICREKSIGTEDKRAEWTHTGQQGRKWHELNYEELSALIDSKDIFLIDVREPREVAETGKIPGSINIPLGDLIHAMSVMSEEEFQSTYTWPRPDRSDRSIVFYGQATWGMPIKSEAAVQIANRLGYMRVRHYVGGFKEWYERNLERK